MAASSPPPPATEATPRRSILYTFGVPWPDLNEGLSYTDLVPANHDGSTLIDFYSLKYKWSAPLEGWLHRIRNRQINIDGRVVTDPDAVLRAGSEVVYHRLPWKEPHAPYMLEVLYEDDDMVAINKPSDLQVLPGGLFQQRTVLKQLEWKKWTKLSASECSSGRYAEEPHPVPVHRLGRGTSGIVLCAKTEAAKSWLATYFANGTSLVGSERKKESWPNNVQRISKSYRALVTGILEKDEVVIEQPIGTMDYPGLAKGLYAASTSGKPALSIVKVLERDMEKSQTLVQVDIHSGRPHQIRIHLAYIGHPLLGDPLYDIGGRPKLLEFESIESNFAEDGGYQKPLRPVPGNSGYHLHAHHLVLHHPSTNEKIEITAHVPRVLETREESDENHQQTSA